MVNMAGTWTFGRKIAAGFALVVVISALSGLVSVSTLRNVVEAKDRVIDVNARNLVHAGSLGVAIEFKAAAFRGYLLTRDPAYLQKADGAKQEIQGILAVLKERASEKEDQRLLAGIEQSETEHQAAVDKATTTGIAQLQPSEIERYFTKEVAPKKEALRKTMLEFIERQERLLKEGKEASDRRAAYLARSSMCKAPLRNCRPPRTSRRREPGSKARP
jgi:CHASE3 domain sensor protein